MNQIVSTFFEESYVGMLFTEYQYMHDVIQHHTSEHFPKNENTSSIGSLSDKNYLYENNDYFKNTSIDGEEKCFSIYIS